MYPTNDIITADHNALRIEWLSHHFGDIGSNYPIDLDHFDSKFPQLPVTALPMFARRGLPLKRFGPEVRQLIVDHNANICEKRGDN